MKVKVLATGKVEECNDGFANRLIEQGKAVLVPAKSVKAEADKKGKARKSGKGD